MLKRSLDIGIASIAIILLVPLWGIIALLIILEDGRPVLYIQRRLGYLGQTFPLYKFRSMKVNNFNPLELGAVKHSHALVTRTGYWLRRTKLDETPQFINVLLGHMSLVGPRPCLIGREATMTAQQKIRLKSKPGLSGWAEVNGNVELTWEEQVALDVWYVAHQNFYLDLKIILKTFYVVFFGSHVNQDALIQAKRFTSQLRGA